VPAESNGPQRKTDALTSQFIDFVSKTTTLFVGTSKPSPNL